MSSQFEHFALIEGLSALIFENISKTLIKNRNTIPFTVDSIKGTIFHKSITDKFDIPYFGDKKILAMLVNDVIAALKMDSRLIARLVKGPNEKNFSLGFWLSDAYLHSTKVPAPPSVSTEMFPNLDDMPRLVPLFTSIVMKKLVTTQPYVVDNLRSLLNDKESPTTKALDLKPFKNKKEMEVVCRALVEALKLNPDLEFDSETFTQVGQNKPCEVFWLKNGSRVPNINKSSAVSAASGDENMTSDRRSPRGSSDIEFYDSPMYLAIVGRLASYFAGKALEVIGHEQTGEQQQTYPVAAILEVLRKGEDIVTTTINPADQTAVSKTVSLSDLYEFHAVDVTHLLYDVMLTIRQLRVMKYNSVRGKLELGFFSARPPLLTGEDANDAIDGDNLSVSTSNSSIKAEKGTKDSRSIAIDGARTAGVQTAVSLAGPLSKVDNLSPTSMQTKVTQALSSHILHHSFQSQQQQHRQHPLFQASVAVAHSYAGDHFPSHQKPVSPSTLHAIGSQNQQTYPMTHNQQQQQQQQQQQGTGQQFPSHSHPNIPELNGTEMEIFGYQELLHQQQQQIQQQYQQYQQNQKVLLGTASPHHGMQRQHLSTPPHHHGQHDPMQYQQVGHPRTRFNAEHIQHLVQQPSHGIYNPLKAPPSSVVSHNNNPYIAQQSQLPHYQQQHYQQHYQQHQRISQQQPRYQQHLLQQLQQQPSFLPHAHHELQRAEQQRYFEGRKVQQTEMLLPPQPSHSVAVRSMSQQQQQQQKTTTAAPPRRQPAEELWESLNGEW